MSPNSKGVEILSIGTELLLGNIINTNAQWISEQLSQLGLNHFRQSTVGDNCDRIIKVIQEISKRSNLLITTGGLGPTPDDLTTEAIAKSFNVTLLERRHLWDEIKQKLSNSKLQDDSSSLRNGGWLDSLGFVDFAGSSIVHSVGAWAGLVGAMLLGPRIGKYSDGKPQAMPGHNMAIATLGALVLWIGWYGFNPGSQLAMDQWVPYVAVTTTLAAAAGAIGATIVSTLTSGKPDLTMIINGILAGLVSITAGCGDMTLAGAWFAGLVGGIIVVFSVAALDAAEIDDPVGAFSVHGVCGVWGTVVIGLWGTAVQGDGAGMGLFNGGGITLLLVQALGAAAYAIWTLVTCWIAWSVIGGLFGGIRVSEEEETQGLDIGEHGMEAYPDFASAK